jgi:hypothetical protein
MVTVMARLTLAGVVGAVVFGRLVGMRNGAKAHRRPDVEDGGGVFPATGTWSTDGDGGGSTDTGRCC